MTTCSLIRPYGEKLVDLFVDAESRSDARSRAASLPSIQLCDRAVCDLELLATGALSPLDRFMGSADLARVLDEMRLADGTLFPVPIVLSVPADVRPGAGGAIALRDARNHLLATLEVDEVFEHDGPKASGRLSVFDLPRRFDFQDLRLGPAATRARLEAMGASSAVAFQSSRPLSPRCADVISGLARERGAAVLFDPVVGTVKAGDIAHFTRIRRYRDVTASRNGSPPTLLCTVPLAIQPAGLRETLWHAIVRRNYGASHVAVGPDHLVPEQLAEEIGVVQIPVDLDDETWAGVHRERDEGFCVWFTGLSGAGKSTTADIVTVLLQERGRTVTLLDGDVVRTHLSKGLGFSREDRDDNIRRIGFVAAEIVKHGGAVVCAAVSPYRSTRDEVRRLVGKDRFIEVYVDTPLDECERRDVKGMYARARQGQIQGFTGIDDPYEAPWSPEVTLETIADSPEHNAGRVLDFLIGGRWIARS
jgi:sulfate adenylyltransferase